MKRNTSHHSWFAKLAALFQTSSNRYAQEMKEYAQGRGEAVRQHIIEHRMQDAARKGIHSGSMIIPSDWDARTLGDLRRLYALSRVPETATALSHGDWGLVHQAARIFGADGQALLPQDLDALAGLATESEYADELTLHTLFDRMQTRAGHIGHMRVQTLKAKGHL